MFNILIWHVNWKRFDWPKAFIYIYNVSHHLQANAGGDKCTLNIGLNNIHKNAKNAGICCPDANEM